jgi:hypothetical protein
MQFTAHATIISGRYDMHVHFNFGASLHLSLIKESCTHRGNPNIDDARQPKEAARTQGKKDGEGRTKVKNGKEAPDKNPQNGEQNKAKGKQTDALWENSSLFDNFLPFRYNPFSSRGRLQVQNVGLPPKWAVLSIGYSGITE